MRFRVRNPNIGKPYHTTTKFISLLVGIVVLFFPAIPPVTSVAFIFGVLGAQLDAAATLYSSSSPLPAEYSVRFKFTAALHSTWPGPSPAGKSS
jgi:hypothetical protein